MKTTLAVSAILAASLIGLCHSAPTSNPRSDDATAEYCYFNEKEWFTKYNGECHKMVMQLEDYVPSAKETDPIKVKARALYDDYISYGKKEFNALLRCYRSLDGISFSHCMKPIRDMAMDNGKVVNGQRMSMLLKMWDYIERYSDRDLVTHCFHHHQRDKYPECRHITWEKNVPIPNENRRKVVSQEWNRQVIARNEGIDQWISSSKINEAQIDFCLYDMRWRKDPTADIRTEYNVNWRNASQADICYLVAYPGRVISFPHYNFKLYRDHVYNLRSMYKSQSTKDLVSDCYRYHRHEKVARCKGVTWNDSGSTFEPLKKYKRLYEDVKAQVHSEYFPHETPKVGLILNLVINVDYEQNY